MPEEIITHSSLVDKFLVNQSKEVPVHPEPPDLALKPSVLTRTAESIQNTAEKTIAQVRRTLSNIDDRIRNGLPEWVLLLFTVLHDLTVSAVEITVEKLRVVHHSQCRVRYGISRRIALSSMPRPAGMMMLMTMVLVVASTTLIGVGLQVSINGEPVGFVSSRSDFTQVVEDVEDRVSGILGYPYTLESDISYNFEMYNRREQLDLDEVERMLFAGISEVQQAYVLKVDGEIIGASLLRTDIQHALDNIMAKYKNENISSIEFLRDVAISLEYTNSSYVMDPSQIQEVAEQNVRDLETYEVRSGDLFPEIAANSGLSVNKLAELNPGVDPNKLQVGQVLVVAEPLPLISVRTTEEIVYREAIPFSTEKIDDNTLYVGTQKVKVKGVPGTKELTASIIRIDGREDSREIISEEVLSNPTTEVIRVGTKKRVATGSYIIPYHGTISSRFGWRAFRGRSNYHTGIDFAGRKGSPIVASDGGTVSYSGWKGALGYTVIIDHGRGIQTVYGHCSKLLVKVGQKVAQGELIARVGSTGNSTGPHLHFEIRVNGKPVNPAPYLW